MILKIQVKKNSTVILDLREKRKIIDKISWKDKQSLLENLLPKIDFLLKRNKISVQELEDVDLKIAMEESYSTYRIAKAIGETLRYCLKRC